MKPTLFSLLVLSSSLVAQEPAPRPAPEAFENGDLGKSEDFDVAPNAPMMVQVTVEFIEVPQAEVTRLLHKEKLGKDGSKLREELQKSVDAQKANLYETMMMTGRSGQKSTAESIREVIYPTEWGAPIMPGCARPPTAEEVQAAKEMNPRVCPALPTAFETRNTGSTLEIEPTIGADDATIDLRVIPEIVFDTGGKKWNVRKDELGNESWIEMPLFYSLRTNTSLVLSDGMPQLLSVLTPKGADGTPDPSRKMLVIVTADIVKVRLKPTR
ncbi:MAG: hypothetical protein CFE26_18060 [Verrucomicrobiales bacterium VVV1]|nr:MAG: hypothetical protein CFE26_18060 [Verrucomicrobiales bacterium VVV1]